MKPLIGVMVLYQFDEMTADGVNQKMVEGEVELSGRGEEHWQLERVQAGQICAGVITNVYKNGAVNLKLFVDAPFDYWIRNVQQWNGLAGNGKNKWRWPLEIQLGDRK